MKREQLHYYTIKYIPYEGWGIHTDERWLWKDQLEKFIKEKFQIIKITKHRIHWKEELENAN